MGKMKELDIERHEDQDILICTLQKKIDDAVRLLTEAQIYVSNPYIDGEEEFPDWMEQVDTFIRTNSPIG